MKLSESIHRNIMQPFVGGLINKFKVKGRRDVLFFEEILANYIKECEKAGHAKEMEEISRTCSNLAMGILAPGMIKKLPITFFINDLGNKVWKNIGLTDYIHVEKDGEKIVMESKNEYITRMIGKNRFSVGFFLGLLNVFFNCNAKCVESMQTKEDARYVCVLERKQFKMPKCKKREVYVRLNKISDLKGFTLKDALSKRIMTISGSRIQFRKKSMIPVENTLFHMFSNRRILEKRVPHISHRFFKDIIEKSSKEKTLTLLKNVLQITGWGAVTITIRGSKIALSIRNPPFGLQEEQDNWDFMLNVILGYLWILDKKLKIKEAKMVEKALMVTYSR